MDNMLEQNILWRMFLEVHFGERVLDLVIDLFLLNDPYFAFSRTNSVTSARNGRSIQETPRLPGSGN